ncbi:hypothetical protein JL720_1097 [Aureococcus anophagefferens]|nr:hypothetical protein JL720_1097 [Aureococcus anophagefferens]
MLPYEIGGLETLDVLDCSENDKPHGPRGAPGDRDGQVRDPLHFDTMGHINKIKQEYVDLQQKLLVQEQSNLRLRDAIENSKSEKTSIIESLIPGSGIASKACTIMQYCRFASFFFFWLRGGASVVSSSPRRVG